MLWVKINVNNVVKNKSSQNTLEIFAPAKLNLFLHVTGKRADKYHTLDSLVCFTDIGDIIKIEKADNFCFAIEGPFASHLSQDRSSNLVVRAAKSLASIVNKPLNIKITLTKNLPIASGLGGGSSNAGATIWGLQDYWGLPHSAPYLSPLLLSLGADLPVCFHCQPSRIQGIGEIINPVPYLPEMPVILINPMKPCLTQNVFLNFQGQYKDNIPEISPLDTKNQLISFLSLQTNDLYTAALTQAPEIQNCINSLNLEKNCKLARMSGSGATCFGLFETLESAENAKENILQTNPDWWIQSGWINRVQRY